MLATTVVFPICIVENLATSPESNLSLQSKTAMIGSSTLPAEDKRSSDRKQIDGWMSEIEFLKVGDVFLSKYGYFFY